MHRIYLVKYVLILLPLFLLSCGKSIFVHEDESGTSKYVIYQDYFKYEEKTKNTDFKVIGYYTIKDSTLAFIWKVKDKLPHHYFSNNIKKMNTNQASGFITLKLIDKDSKAPIIYAPIALVDSTDKIIEVVETDFDGVAYFQKSSEIQHLEIEFTGYANVNVDYEEYRNYEILIELESLKRGGRMSDGCFGYYLDYILEYKISNKKDFDRFERNGVAFHKVKED